MLNYKLISYQINTDEGLVWVAEYPSLKGVVGTGLDVSSAVLNLEENAEVHVSVLKDLGMEVPKEDAVQSEDVYSGRITIRTSKSTHMRVLNCAKEEGVSLNSWINEAISFKLGHQDALGTIVEEIKDIYKQLGMRIYKTSSKETNQRNFMFERKWRSVENTYSQS